MEYIDREAALAATCQYCSAKEDCLPNERCADYELINSIPAADVVPVRHGSWDVSYMDGLLVCSECMHYWIYKGEQYDYHYCPNCGAKMDGGTE